MGKTHRMAMASGTFCSRVYSTVSNVNRGPNIILINNTAYSPDMHLQSTVYMYTAVLK
jgi:hypothetical protein